MKKLLKKRYTVIMCFFFVLLFFIFCLFVCLFLFFNHSASVYHKTIRVWQRYKLLPMIKFWKNACIQHLRSAAPLSRLPPLLGPRVEYSKDGFMVASFEHWDKMHQAVVNITVKMYTEHIPYAFVSDRGEIESLCQTLTPDQAQVWCTALYMCFSDNEASF